MTGHARWLVSLVALLLAPPLLPLKPWHLRLPLAPRLRRRK